MGDHHQAMAPAYGNSYAASNPASAGHTPPGFGGASASNSGPNSPTDGATPLLFVDVNIAPGQPPERIILREGQSVAEVAAEFAAKHVLTPVLAQRLHALLREVLQRQEQHVQNHQVQQQQTQMQTQRPLH